MRVQNRVSLVSEHLNVVQEASAAGQAIAGRLPQQAGGVDDVAKEDGRGDVTENAEDDKLDAQGKGLFFLFDRPTKARDTPILIASMYHHQHHHVPQDHH